RNIEQKYHLSLVFIERRTLQPALVGDEQRLHRAKNRFRILSVVESNSDATARVRIKPEQKPPAEGSNKQRHRPCPHTAGEPEYHDCDRFPSKFRIVEHRSKSQ